MNRERLDGIGMTSQRARDRLVDKLRSLGIASPAVLGVIAATPRHIFVDEALSSHAYENKSLPIGFGQTISQPYTVARMTEVLLECSPCRKVLEVGTGSGYQAVVLAQLCEEVFTVERIAALLNRARQCFRDMGLRNIRSRHTDGGQGWPDNGPYDGIMVTAAMEQIPEDLLTQLAPGGCMVLPLATAQGQRLQRILHTGTSFEMEDMEDVRFVPFLGGKR